MRPVHTLARVFQSVTRWTVGLFAEASAWVVSAVGWLGMLRPQVYLVRGQEQASQLPLTVLCAVSNDGKNRNYLLQLLFGDTYEARSLGRYWIWNLRRAVSKSGGDCPVIVAELRRSHFGLTSWKDWFYIPTWVWGEISLPRDSRANQKVSGDLRRIRRHGLEYEVTRDPAKFDDFYHNMYIPYIKETFGPCAEIAPYDRMKIGFRRGALLLITQGEKSIAGQLLLNYGDGACLENMGVRDGDRNYVKEGAACALYHYGLKHMQDEGLKRAWVAWTRPFLRDGVLRFKKKWSQRIIDSGSNGFALRVSLDDPAARSFLCHNPFIWEHYGQYYGAVFTDSDQLPAEEELRLLDRDYFHPGMDCLYVYCLQSRQGPSKDGIPADLQDRLEPRGTASIPGG